MAAESLAVLFADLAGSTQLYQTEGDVEAHQRIAESLQCMRIVIEKHGGTLLRTVGDAVLASFQCTDACCSSAVDIQREHRALNLSVRVGFHYGEVIPDAGDVYGNAVNIAARVAAFAKADEICITEDAVALLSDGNRANAFYLDKVGFKGISSPMPVYRVQWAGDNSDTAIITAGGFTDKIQNNLVLDLLIGAKRLVIDQWNTSLTFGRSFDNDVIVNAESASRNHAKIEFTRGRFLIHDSSTNGTYLIRGGFTPEFIRRETASLENFGSIGLGFSPAKKSLHVIEFRITTSAK